MNATELAPELLQAAQYFFDQIPFNHLVGIQVDSLSTEEVRMHVSMREELVGNHIQGILHGGVIASILDVAGGAMALIGAFQRLPELPVVERMMSLSKLGTIDMRVDYLRQVAVNALMRWRPCCVLVIKSQWCVPNCTMMMAI